MARNSKCKFYTSQLNFEEIGRFLPALDFNARERLLLPYSVFSSLMFCRMVFQRSSL